MKLALVLMWVGVLALAPVKASAQTVLEHHEVTEHHAPWEPGKRLAIRHSFGAVRLRTVEGAVVSVRAQKHLSGMTRQAMQAYLQALKISVQALDDRIEIATIRPPGENKLLMQTTVDLDVTYPPGVPVQVDTTFGDLDAQEIGDLKATAPFGAITVRGSTGDVTLEGRNGKILVSDVRGSVSVTHSLGDVEVTRVGGALTVRNQFAQIRAQGIGQRAVVESRGGPISLMNLSGGAEVNCQRAQVDVSRVTGDLQVTNQDESVKVQDTRGTVVVANANGPVTVRQISGDLKIDNRFGAVAVEQVNGKVTVQHSNGELTVGQVEGPVVLTNSHGLVQVDDIRGDCKVRNEFAAVTARNIWGRLDVLNAWGLVQADLPPAKPRPAPVKGGGAAAPKGPTPDPQAPAAPPAWYLETNHNNVILGVPPGAGCALSIEVNTGMIDKSPFPLARQRAGARDSATGVIQGGGLRVDVRVDLGMVQIQKRPAGVGGPPKK